MDIKIFPFGQLGANMYLVWDSGSYIIFDPCCPPEKVKENNRIDGFDFNGLKAIFLTHGHFDHITYVDSWKSMFPDVPVYVHEGDKDCFDDSVCNGSIYFDSPLTFNCVPYLLGSINSQYTFGNNVEINVIHTPGHSKGSVCYTIVSPDTDKKYMITGDMLFRGAVGRTDLPGGDEKEMFNSIALLKEIKEDYFVFPGHGFTSTLFEEHKTNPYFFYI